MLLDLWESGPPVKQEFTTVGNWKQEGRDIQYEGETYYWSKDREFLKFIDLPRRLSQPIELATSLGSAARPLNETVSATGLDPVVRQTLESNGWRLADADTFTTDPWAYRDYLRASRGEFTVAKDIYVRPNSGWFSDRSACYLASGRPVVTMKTGFDKFYPAGEGLFQFLTLEEALEAFRSIDRDYARHARAARGLAEEFFGSDRVLSDMMVAAGL